MPQIKQIAKRARNDDEVGSSRGTTTESEAGLYQVQSKTDVQEINFRTFYTKSIGTLYYPKAAPLRAGLEGFQPIDCTAPPEKIVLNPEVLVEEEGGDAGDGDEDEQGAAAGAWRDEPHGYMPPWEGMHRH
ncbi:unnamed protein product [Cuscuta europaea]|uniref:Uncharacterized protein n=1 Tax=Cuscuta europaea TaxID=41803 RepID=A0A9P1E5T3_CUSEU|nr:unnamed protein product [Cuscuta europaea]